MLRHRPLEVIAHHSLCFTPLLLFLQVTEVSKVVGEMWGKASDKEKEKYQKKADEVSRGGSGASTSITACMYKHWTT